MNPLINQSKNLAKHGITNLFAIKLRERERERERERIILCLRNMEEMVEVRAERTFNL